MNSKGNLKARPNPTHPTVTAATEHWRNYADAFAWPIQTNGLVNRFVTNPAVTGAYAEAWVRAMTRTMLGHRFEISTGAVIRPGDSARGLLQIPQCDIIIWDPSEMPGLFHTGGFALVPFAAARAVIEIKRTARLAGLAQQLESERAVVPTGFVLGIVVSHPKDPFTFKCTPDWLTQLEDHESPPMLRLLDKTSRPDVNGVMAFIYFLAQLSGHDRTFVAK